MDRDLVTGDPLVVCGPRFQVVAWNAAAEALTGVPAAEAVGLTCWRALRGVDAAGAAICRPGCGHGRRAVAGCPMTAHDLYVGTADGGHRRVRASMVSLRAGAEGGFAIVMQDQRDPLPERRPATAARPLTPRQRQVLGLLAEGVPVRAIAERLGLSESTVRGYMRRIRMVLGCRSQLEAVAAARRAGLL